MTELTEAEVCKLREIRERVFEVGEGEWEQRNRFVLERDTGSLVAEAWWNGTSTDSERPVRIASFIAAAPDDIGFLLFIVEKLECRLATMIHERNTWRRQADTYWRQLSHETAMRAAARIEAEEKGGDQ